MGTFHEWPHNYHFKLLLWVLNVRKTFALLALKSRWSDHYSCIWIVCDVCCLHFFFLDEIFTFRIEKMDPLWNILAVRESRKTNLWHAPWWKNNNCMIICLNITKSFSKLAVWPKSWQIPTIHIGKRWSNET